MKLTQFSRSIQRLYLGGDPEVVVQLVDEYQQPLPLEIVNVRRNEDGKVVLTMEKK